MKTTLLTFTLLVALSVNAQKLKDFSWLEGIWERQNTKPGTMAYEVWKKHGKLLMGKGLTLRGSDTVFVEKLRLVNIEGAWNYTAEVSHNAGPTYFKITSWSEDGFVSENPEHDFPKKIEYKLDGDLLTATISGDGKEIPFLFIKKE